MITPPNIMMGWYYRILLGPPLTDDEREQMRKDQDKQDRMWLIYGISVIVFISLVGLAGIMALILHAVA